jgi:outer membrane protein assembly factor BamD
VEAAASYLLFKDFHPRHKKIDYVVFRVAESYYKQLPSTFDRDLNSGREAISFYKDLQKNHGSSQYAECAKNKIEKIEKMIINREKYVADFYFKTKVYGAARFRCLSIIDRFQDKSLQQHCMTRVMLSSLRLDEPRECEEYYRRFSGLFDNKQEKARFENAYKKCKGAL